jgi:hypothetical protein
MNEINDAQKIQQIRNKLMSVEDIPTWEELHYLFEEYSPKQIFVGCGGRWLSFCDKHHIYHAFCREFVKGLAEVLKELEDGNPMIEVCAGNGKLSYWLRQYGTLTYATDDYSEDMIRDTNYVERLSHREALEKYKPRLVIGCWIPYKSSVAIDVLNFPSTKYYLDIGEGCYGCTGVEELWKREDVGTTFFKNVRCWSLSRTDFDIISRHSNAVLFTKCSANKTSENIA